MSGTEEQKLTSLKPLLDPKLGHGNGARRRVVGCEQHRHPHRTQGDEWVINGRKCWIKGHGRDR
jgi:alkylation response protein AidB-like acyl-CoA dehydrogenase